MKTLYTDAGYTWQNTAKTKDGEPIMGRICVADTEEFSRIEMAGVGKVPVLKQYINVFELIAIARAVEIAIEMGWVGSLQIKTDSKTAMIWASHGMKDSPKKTDAHKGALEYLRTARKNYGGVITFNHVGRDHNPAGKLLEVELEKDRELRKNQEVEVEQKDEPINRGNVEIGHQCDCDCHRDPMSDGHMKLNGCDVCVSLHQNV